MDLSVTVSATTPAVLGICAGGRLDRVGTSSAAGGAVMDNSTLTSLALFGGVLLSSGLWLWLLWCFATAATHRDAILQTMHTEKMSWPVIEASMRVRFRTHLLWVFFRRNWKALYPQEVIAATFTGTIFQ